MSLFSPTCEPSQETIFGLLDPSTSSLGESRASHGQSPASKGVPTTPATSGPTSSLSPSASAQRRFWSRMSLASRAILEDLTGSRVTLSGRATAGGLPVCVLRTSARPTSATGCSSAQSGWGTPKESDHRPGLDSRAFDTARINLNDQSLLVRWPTATTQDHCSRNFRDDGSRYRKGGSYGQTLTDAASMVDWPTPQSRAHKGDGGPILDHNARPLNEVARWATPNTVDAKGGSQNGEGQSQVAFQAHGLTPDPSSAETAKPGSYRLNWRFSQWLMGLPAGWLDSELWAMPSSRFKPTSRPEPSTR